MENNEEDIDIESNEDIGNTGGFKNKLPVVWDRRTKYIVLAALVGITLVAVIIAGVQFYNRDQAEGRLRELAEGTWVTGAPDGTDEATKKDSMQLLLELDIPIPEKEVDFASLQAEVNPDIYAWIYMPGTMIDYPVVQHPTDNTHYLNYNLDGSKGYPGCIYTENYNSEDFQDPNTVLYGHNMRNGTMFAGLHQFKNTEFFDEHPYVYIYTEEGLLVYEIFAAYEAGNEHILYTYDFTDDTVYHNYLEGVLKSDGANDNVRGDLDVTEKNRIITLSTCISGRSNDRYLIQGVLLNG